MALRDLHRALRSEVVAQASSANPSVDLIVARVQWAKDDLALGLHARPSSYSSSGIQTTDLLAMLGFERGACGQLRGECYSTEVAAEFDVRAFAGVLGDVYQAVEDADQHLSACGLALPRSEGWGFFYGKPSSERVLEHRGGGDGHEGMKVESMKVSEDEIFRYAFSWRVAEEEMGWIIHYTPKHAPVSPDVMTAFGMVGLRSFAQCPEFDFEPCWWRYFPRESDDFRVAEFPHRAFDAHAQHFSEGLKQLVVAHEKVQPFGLRLLPEAVTQRLPRGAAPRVRQASSPMAVAEAAERRAASDPKFRYDVAISFAGAQRSIAEALALAVRDAGYEVFFDGFYPEHLWGRDLTVFFDQVFRRDARYCVMLVSKEYVDRLWTTRERQSAMARAVAERGNEYILPIQVESVEVPGLLPTIGYVPLSGRRIEEIAELLTKKLALK